MMNQVNRNFLLVIGSDMKNKPLWRRLNVKNFVFHTSSFKTSQSTNESSLNEMARRWEPARFGMCLCHEKDCTAFPGRLN
jgi:hypothetical protein